MLLRFLAHLHTARTARTDGRDWRSYDGHPCMRLHPTLDVNSSRSLDPCLPFELAYHPPPGATNRHLGACEAPRWFCIPQTPTGTLGIVSRRPPTLAESSTYLGTEREPSLSIRISPHHTSHHIAARASSRPIAARKHIPTRQSPPNHRCCRLGWPHLP